MQSTLKAIGKLTTLNFSYTTSGMAKAELEIDMQGRPFIFRAIGALAEYASALLGEAPAGVTLNVDGTLSFRTFVTQEGEERVFTDAELVNVQLQPNVGVNEGFFKIQGFLLGVEAKHIASTGNTMYIARVAPIHFNKEGHIPGVYLEVNIGDAQVAEYTAATGKFVTVAGKLGGSKGKQPNADGSYRIFARYNGDSLVAMEVPSWLVPYAPDPSQFISPDLAAPAPVAGGGPVVVAGDIPF